MTVARKEIAITVEFRATLCPYCRSPRSHTYAVTRHPALIKRWHICRACKQRYASIEHLRRAFKTMA